MKRTIALILVLLTFLTVFTGCSQVETFVKLKEGEKVVNGLENTFKSAKYLSIGTYMQTGDSAITNIIENDDGTVTIGTYAKISGKTSLVAVVAGDDKSTVYYQPTDNREAYVYTYTDKYLKNDVLALKNRLFDDNYKNVSEYKLYWAEYSDVSDIFSEYNFKLDTFAFSNNPEEGYDFSLEYNTDENFYALFSFARPLTTFTKKFSSNDGFSAIFALPSFDFNLESLTPMDVNVDTDAIVLEAVETYLNYNVIK